MPSNLSPFRFPGGKTKITPLVSKTIVLNFNQDKPIYIEPFAGGFGVGLNLLKQNQIKEAIINELNPGLYSVWKYILQDPITLINKIKKTDVTIDEWHRQRKIHQDNKDQINLDNAFSTWFLNRTNVSGIITGGVIGGLQQRGKYKVDCRFNKLKLIQKIEWINSQKDRIKLFNVDGSELIKQLPANNSGQKIFMLIDPPYYKEGKTLYENYFDRKDHIRLRDALLNLNQDDWIKWIETYDINQNVYKLYKDQLNCYTYDINYSVTKAHKAKEYIFADKNTLLESTDKININKI